MGASDVPDRVDQVRRFNRFYTRQIGVLDEGFLRSPFSLAEGRVLYELAHSRGLLATQVGNALGLDAGYLSRILARFESSGLVKKQRSKVDGRQQTLTLTSTGKRALAGLDAASREGMRAVLEPMARFDRWRLIDAMQSIERLLTPEPDQSPPFTLRQYQAGDMGWVLERHGALYFQEYGWDIRCEALFAEVVTNFLQHYDPSHERCWIAERRGARVGSIFLVRHPERPGVAKLRLLLVEPEARGLGVGRALVRACTEFARACGYHTITLWTQSILLAARRLYAEEGYTKVHEAPHASFGPDLVEEVWELGL
jgi:DNA-binding MarR family transcriptional regulator/ribosomal protein S18 acetylase RimI-like enzyme